MKRNREAKARIRIVSYYQMDKLDQRKLDQIIKDRGIRYHDVQRGADAGICCSVLFFTATIRKFWRKAVRITRNELAALRRPERQL